MVLGRRFFLQNFLGKLDLLIGSAAMSCTKRNGTSWEVLILEINIKIHIFNSQASVSFPTCKSQVAKNAHAVLGIGVKMLILCSTMYVHAHTIILS